MFRVPESTPLNLLIWILLIVLILNRYQRRYHDEARNKRTATLFWAGLILALIVILKFITRFSLSLWFVLAGFCAVGAAARIFRARLFPFTFRCQDCSAPLRPARLLGSDSNLCSDCETSSRSRQNGSS